MSKQSTWNAVILSRDGSVIRRRSHPTQYHAEATAELWAHRWPILERLGQIKVCKKDAPA